MPISVESKFMHDAKLSHAKSKQIEIDATLYLDEVHWYIKLESKLIPIKAIDREHREYNELMLA